MVGREAALADVAERLETRLQLLGATAVEDRLQEGVPQAIATLLRAGLKVPCSTADRLMTTRQVWAVACGSEGVPQGHCHAPAHRPRNVSIGGRHTAVGGQ